MKRVIPFVLALSLSGCASAGDYTKYADTQLLLKQEDTKAAIAYANAEAARYTAISTIAVAGNETAKAVGMMALQNSSGSSKQQPTTTVLVQPKSFSDTALQWASVLVNPVVSIYGITSGRRMAETQSNNSRDVAISTNSAFVGMASQIQAPTPNYTIGGNGVIGDGTYTTTDFSGTGVLGSGAYTTNALGGAGVIGSGTYSTPVDDHSNTNNPITNPYITAP